MYVIYSRPARRAVSGPDTTRSYLELELELEQAPSSLSTEISHLSLPRPLLSQQSTIAHAHVRDRPPGDNVNSAVETFGTTHGLTPDELTSLKAEITRRFLSIAQAVNGAPPAAAAAKEPLFEIPVGLGDGRVVPLRLFEGDNLVRAVQQFAKDQNIPEDVVPSLFEEVKKRVFPNAEAADGAAAAAAPNANNPDLIFDIPIDVDGNVQYLKLYRGDVLGDRVKEFAAEHKLSDEVAQKMLEVRRRI